MDPDTFYGCAFCVGTLGLVGIAQAGLYASPVIFARHQRKKEVTNLYNIKLGFLEQSVKSIREASPSRDLYLGKGFLIGLLEMHKDSINEARLKAIPEEDSQFLKPEFLRQYEATANTLVNLVAKTSGLSSEEIEVTLGRIPKKEDNYHKDHFAKP